MDIFSFKAGKKKGASSGGSVTVEPLSATENGTYTSESGKAFNPVVVDVPEPTGSIEITENGTYDVKDIAEAVVDVASGDPWERFDEFVSATDNGAVRGGLAYIKRNYMSGIPRIFTSGNRQLAYSHLQFFSVKSFSKAYNYVETQTFYSAAELKYCRLLDMRLIMTKSFTGSISLKSLVITNKDEISGLHNIDAFANSGIGKGNGYVYVKDSLVDSYKSATNWSTYATQIKGFSEAPTYDDTTTYEIGDVCQYNSKFYGYCKEDLTSSVGNAPTGTNEDNAYWEYVDDIVTE